MKFADDEILQKWNLQEENKPQMKFANDEILQKWNLQEEN